MAGTGRSSRPSVEDLRRAWLVARLEEDGAWLKVHDADLRVGRRSRLQRSTAEPDDAHRGAVGGEIDTSRTCIQ